MFADDDHDLLFLRDPADPERKFRWINLYFTHSGNSEPAGFWYTEKRAIRHSEEFFAEWRTWTALHGDALVEFPSGVQIPFSELSHSIPIPVKE